MTRRPPIRRLRVLLALGVVLVATVAVIAEVVGGNSEKTPLPPSAATANRSREGREVIRRSATPTPEAAARARVEASFPSSVRRRAARMTLPRQVAQIFAAGFDGYFPRAPFFERLKRKGWGAVVLERRNFQSESQIGALAGEVGRVAKDAGLVAPIVAAPQVGGEESAFPGLGPSAPPDVGSAARASSEAGAAADRLRALGLNLTLAPVADVGGEASPAAGTSFSDDPVVAARLVPAAIRAYREHAVAPAVGHFPGQGSASQDPQRGPATVGLSLQDLRRRDLRPFAAAVRARVPVVIMSNALYAAWDGITPAVLLPEAHAVLRSLGFRGVVMSDDLVGAQAATGAGIGELAVSALQAGTDLLYVSGGAGDQETAYRAVLRAVRDGTISRDRIRQSVLRILDLKRRYKVGG